MRHLFALRFHPPSSFVSPCLFLLFRTKWLRVTFSCRSKYLRVEPKNCTVSAFSSFTTAKNGRHLLAFAEEQLHLNVHCDFTFTRKLFLPPNMFESLCRIDEGKYEVKNTTRRTNKLQKFVLRDFRSSDDDYRDEILRNKGTTFIGVLDHCFRFISIHYDISSLSECFFS